MTKYEEAVGRMKLLGKTEVLGEDMTQCHFIHHSSHVTTWDRTWVITGATNHLSHDRVMPGEEY
jgi:hypothetical protein